MKFFENFKAEMIVIQKQLVEMNKIECANKIKLLKRLCNELIFNVWMLKCDLIKGRNIK